MAPLRRYLRIAPHSVLEVRIYLDDPIDMHRWLVRAQDPALTRVIQAVKPLILPKLREEDERSKGKSAARARTRLSDDGKGKAKTKAIKDVVQGDDFEVSIFLTDPSSRHSVLVKEKRLKSEQSGGRTGGGSMSLNSHQSRLADAGTSSERPVEIRDEDSADTATIRQEDDEDGESGAIDLDSIPMADEVTRQRDAAAIKIEDDAEPTATDRNEDDDNGLFVSESNDINNEGTQNQGATNVSPRPHQSGNGDDKKKKMGFSMSYTGYSIYGRILCLVVKRRTAGMVARASDSQAAGGVGGQAMMEDWIASTQLQKEAGVALDE